MTKVLHYRGLLFFILKKSLDKVFLTLVAVGLMVNGIYLWLEHSNMHDLDGYYDPLLSQYKGELTDDIMIEIDEKNQEMEQLLDDIYMELQNDFLEQVFEGKTDIIGKDTEIDNEKIEEADRRLAQSGNYSDTIRNDIRLWGQLYNQSHYLYQLPNRWNEMNEIAQRNIDRNPNKNSFAYKEWTLYISKISSLKAPLLEDMRSWEGFFKCYGNDIFMLILILLILSPIFSNDYANGMFKLQKSTTCGASGLASIKIWAGIIITSIIFIIFTSQHILFFILYNHGFRGISQPLQAVQYFGHSVQPWTAGEYMMILLGLRYLTCISIGLMTLVISSIFRTAFVTFIASVVLCYLPYTIGKLIQNVIPTNMSFLLSYPGALRVNEFFNKFIVIDFFNHPLYLSVLIYVIIAVLCFFYIGFIKKWAKFTRA